MAAQSSAERVQLFTESTRVYGDYFVIIDQRIVDTKSDETATITQVDIYLQIQLHRQRITACCCL